MKIWKAFAFAFAVAMVASESEAARIAGGGINQLGASMDLTGTVSTLAENTNNTAQNTVTLNLSVKQLLITEPFVLTLENGTGNQSTLYRVTVNLTNNTTIPHVISGFDMRVQALGGLGGYTAYLPPSLPASANVVSSDFYVAPNYRLNALPSVSDNTYRFGGLSGSGGEIMPTQTGSVSFDLQIGSFFDQTGANGTLNLYFTANPEPTTLLLGSLVMVPAGIAIRRRRKAAASAEAAV